MVSSAKGISLNFEELCRKYELNSFERKVVMFLFVFHTSVAFKSLIDNCGVDRWETGSDDMTVGTIISILCPEYRDQIRERKWFSIENKLVRQELILLTTFNNSDIISADVQLHESSPIDDGRATRSPATLLNVHQGRGS